jgi:hypothetical protein
MASLASRTNASGGLSVGDGDAWHAAFTTITSTVASMSDRRRSTWNVLPPVALEICTDHPSTRRLERLGALQPMIGSARKVAAEETRVDLVRYLYPMALYFGPIGLGIVVGLILFALPGAIIGGVIGAGVTWFMQKQRA